MNSAGILDQTREGGDLAEHCLSAMACSVQTGILVFFLSPT